MLTKPRSFKEASKDHNWIQANHHEIDALEGNKTWELVPLPVGKGSIGSKWVYKIKYKVNGEIHKYKTRLVAKGYTQREGLDYHKTFSPVAKMVRVRTIISVVTSKNWFLYQMDVNNCFLHGDLYEEVYIDRRSIGYANY